MILTGECAATPPVPAVIVKLLSWADDVPPIIWFPEVDCPTVHTFVALQYFLSPVVVLKISAVVPGVQVPGSVAT